MRYKKKVRQYARWMRVHPTPAEKILIQELKDKCVQFFSQVPIFKGKSGYIVDLLFKREDKPILVVEIDGESHNQSVEYDIKRTADLAGKGFEVLRFENKEVYEDPSRVVDLILESGVKVVYPSERQTLKRRVRTPLKERVQVKGVLKSLYKNLSPRDKALLRKELEYKESRGIKVANPIGR